MPTRQGIPTGSGEGEQGPPGVQGVGIESVEFSVNNSTLSLGLNMTNGTTQGPFNATFTDLESLDQVTLSGTANVNKLEVQDLNGNVVFNVNTATDAVTTRFNTLDDGSGNVIITGTVTTTLPASSIVQTTSGSQLTASNTLPTSCTIPSATISNPTITGLTASELVQTNVSGQVVTSNTLPTSCTIPSATISNPTITGLTASELLHTNVSGQVVTSNVLPSGCIITSPIITNPTITNPTLSGTITTGLTTSEIVQTNGSGQLVASNTLPSSCTIPSPTISNPTISNPTITGLTASELLQTNSSGQVVTSNTLPTGCTMPSATITNPTITGLTASQVVQTNSSGQLVTSNALSGVAVTASTVDSTPIGATTPSSGAFTSLSASGNIRFGTTGLGYTYEFTVTSLVTSSATEYIPIFQMAQLPVAAANGTIYLIQYSFVASSTSGGEYAYFTSSVPAQLAVYANTSTNINTFGGTFPAIPAVTYVGGTGNLFSSTMMQFNSGSVVSGNLIYFIPLYNGLPFNITIAVKVIVANS